MSGSRAWKIVPGCVGTGALVHHPPAVAFAQLQFTPAVAKLDARTNSATAVQTSAPRALDADRSEPSRREHDELLAGMTTADIR